MTQRTRNSAPTPIHTQVAACRAGKEPRVIARLESGWAVMGPAQFLPGYCLLLPDPVVGSLNDMAEPDRAAFLRDMTLLGDAVTKVVKPRRINYEMLGNLAPALHAHIIPRRTDEPKDLRTKAVWLYPDSAWSDPATTFNPKKPAHARLKRAIFYRKNIQVAFYSS